MGGRDRVAARGQRGTSTPSRGSLEFVSRGQASVFATDGMSGRTGEYGSGWDIDRESAVIGSVGCSV